MRKKAPTLRKSYTRIFIAIVVLTTAVSCLLVSFLMLKQSKERIRRDDEWLLSQLCETALYLADSAENLSSTLAFDQEIQSLLISYEYDDSVSLNIDDVRLAINQRLVNKSNFNKALYDCRGVILFSNEGRVVGSKETFNMNASISEYEWFSSVESSDGKAIWLPLSYDGNSRSTRNSLSIPIVRKVYSTQSSSGNTLSQVLTLGKPLGYLLMYIDNALFSDIVSEYSRTVKQFFIVDANNTIISAEDQKIVGAELVIEEGNSGYYLYDGETYLKSERSLDKLGWRYICLTSSEEVEREAKVIFLVCSIIGIFLALAFVFVAFILSKYTEAPIHRLIDSFKKAEKGRVTIEEKADIAEFQLLYDSFNETIKTIYELTDKVYETERDKQELILSSKESQIQALQNQINPHFLYNTLDCINWQAQLRGEREIAGMICTLGKFFRSNIRITENTITLRQELENVNLYMELVKYRLGSRLSYHVSCPDNLLDYKVLRLLLQPFVENSLKHGIEDCAGNGRISIDIKEEGESLKISVEDNGVGIDDKTRLYFEQLWNDAGGAYIKENKSIGLYNVFRRLRLSYHKEAMLSISSNSNEVTRIVITIPKKKLNES